MKDYEVIAHTRIGIYATIVTADNESNAIKKARPELNRMAHYNKLLSVYVEDPYN